ncbi:hypothetical protein BDY19DRAFT_987352 [Irpex rosettiformis]|uniref:Uncharacterized protein n=1 Tax=Irpex rosettiformis TaxID=378272 RepID=A0ACB8TS29_9APHY|nr:hypothetical protein BDY19DRAFT_987352 [Irpex rosettiformis]
MIHTKPSQIGDFRLEDLADATRRQQPRLWSLVFLLATGHLDSEHMPDEEEVGSIDEDEDVGEGEGEGEGEELIDGAESVEEKGDRRKRRIHGLRIIKAVTIICILAQSRFQKCNIFQATMGIFLHSCRAPEKLIKVLCRMGVSVSLASIHRAVHSLSRQSSFEIQRTGRSLLVSYAYDNFDVKFNTGIPTVDGPSDLLVHMTSGMMLKLGHGVKLDDLRVSGSLWDMNPNNPYASNPKEFNPIQAFELLHTLHPPRAEVHVQGRPRGNYHSRFRAWMFLQTLITYGPVYFSGMKAAVGDPPSVESIPICKTEQVPLRAMDINQSRVSGNIDAIFDMFAQAGVGKEGAQSHGLEEVDITPFVQLIHGDLGTMEWDRLQFVVFVLGLFHFKMAAADALWRILVTPKEARKDPTSFMAFVERLRPKSANKLVNNAAFREQHDLIGHVGNILRLDVWQLEAAKLGYCSLKDWAESKPPVNDVIALSEQLVQKYVEGGDGISLFRAQNRPTDQRDKQHENTMRTHAYLLLYEELSYAMNAGDIGRVETLFLPWVQIFKATGKHKYANRTLLFIHYLYNVFPPGLRRAIRYNMLVNPTGKPNHFRAVDWMVELLNLYTKEIYGGEGSNYTKKRILEESPLVLVYRQSHANFERNFHLPGLSTAHAKKDMTLTFQEVLLYIKSLEASPNKHHSGRSAKYIVPDVLTRGSSILETEAWHESHDEDIWHEIGSTERMAAGDDGYSRDRTTEITSADLATDDAL